MLSKCTQNIKLFIHKYLILSIFSYIQRARYNYSQLMTCDPVAMKYVEYITVEGTTTKVYPRPYEN